MKKVLPIVFFCLFYVFSITAQTIHYVKADATGTNDGSNWANAYTHLQDAIAVATSGNQIWVAVGTYKPTSGIDRNSYFELKNGVQLYGGFLGSETTLAERDYIHNETILSGDIGMENDSTDNAYTVVYAENTSDENTIIEGFIIENGNAFEETSAYVPKTSGAGMYITATNGGAAKCQVLHCTFRDNHAKRGAAMIVYPTEGATANPRLFANKFVSNSSETGNVLFYQVRTNSDTLLVADSLMFDNNSSTAMSILSDENTTVLLQLKNSSFTNGGGTALNIESNPEQRGVEILSSHFESNEGNGINYTGKAKNVRIDSCSFLHNHSGIYLVGDGMTGNEKVTVSNSVFTWNISDASGGGIANYLSGGVLLEVDKCRFIYNGADLSGGGIYNFTTDTPLHIYSSYFQGNGATNATGGAIHYDGNNLKVYNSVFHTNSGKTGGGIRTRGGEIINCVFYKNQALQQGGAIRCNQPTIANCIFYENTNFGIGPDIFNNSFPLTVRSCFFSAGSCAEINYNNSNISCDEQSFFGLDPQFVNPEVGNFTVQNCSPVVNAGDSSYLINTDITEDFYGNYRYQGSSIDIGAAESPTLQLIATAGAVGDCFSTEVQSGSINYNAQGACVPLTITVAGNEMETNELTGTISNLAGGTYPLSIVDFAGNVLQDTIFIPTQSEIFVEANTQNTTCSDYADGSIMLTGLDNAQLTSVTWADDNSTSFTRSSLAAGDYTFTATDNNGCIQNSTVTVGAPDSLTVTGETLNTVCDADGGGAIYLTVSGGNGDYSYQWTPNPNNQTGAALLDVGAGIYNVLVTDAVGCQSLTSHIVETAAELALNPEIISPNCFAENTGAIALYPSNGAPDYIYNWSNGSTTSEILEITAGTYTVTVTDVNGCEVIEIFTVNNPLFDYTFDANINNPSCFGGTDGSIDLEIDVTGGLSFQWSENANNQTGTIAANLGAGTYTVKVYDELGCEDTNEYVVTEPTELVAQATTSNVSCAGLADGFVVIDATGGTGAYSYGGETVALSAGNYTVTVTDEAGCNTSVPFMIEEPLLLMAEVVSVNNTSCPGFSDGSVVLDISGGTGAYVYAGDTGGLAAGNYTVTITDEMNCMVDVDFMIEEPMDLEIVSDITNATNSNSNDGSIEISEVTGGTAPYTYEWADGTTTQDRFMLAGPMAYNLAIVDAEDCVYNYGFDVGIFSDIDNLNKAGLKVVLLPNITAVGEPVYLHFSSENTTSVQLSVFNLLGQKMQTSQETIFFGNATEAIPTEELNAGVYFIEILLNTGERGVLELIVK